MGNSPQSRELGSGPRQLLVNLHSEPVVHSLVLGHLQWSCWHQVGRGRDVPEASVMQNAAPTAKCPQALNAGGEKASDLEGQREGAPYPGPTLSTAPLRSATLHLLAMLPSRPIPPLHNNLHISFMLNSQPNGHK